MRRNLLVGLTVGLMMIGHAVPSQALLVGISTDTDALYTIDQTTGIASMLTPTNGDFAGVGLTYINNKLYATDQQRYENGSFPASGLYMSQVDMVSGAVTPFTLQAGSLNWDDLASDQSTGYMYSVDIDQGNMLMRVNATTGNLASVGTTGIVDGRGLVFNPSDSMLYGTSMTTNSLYKINPNTGASTLVGALGFDATFLGLALDYSTGTMYANVVPRDVGGGLYTVDMLTGASTFVGGNRAPFIDGLVWIPESTTAPVPEPSTMILLGVGMFGLAVYGRRHTNKIK